MRADEIPLQPTASPIRLTLQTSYSEALELARRRRSSAEAEANAQRSLGSKQQVHTPLPALPSPSGRQGGSPKSCLTLPIPITHTVAQSGPASEASSGAAPGLQSKGLSPMLPTAGLGHYRGAVLGSRGYDDLRALQAGCKLKQSELSCGPQIPSSMRQQPGRQPEPVKTLLLRHHRRKSQLMAGVRDVSYREGGLVVEEAAAAGATEAGRLAKQGRPGLELETAGAEDGGQLHQLPRLSPKQQQQQQQQEQLPCEPFRAAQQGDLGSKDSSRRVSKVDIELELLQTGRLLTPPEPLEQPSQALRRWVLPLLATVLQYLLQLPSLLLRRVWCNMPCKARTPSTED